MAKFSMWTGSDEQIEELLSMREAGSTVRQIAKHFHCRTDVVSDVLREQLGVPVPQGGQERLTANQREAMFAGYREGRSFRSLGREFGITAATVSAMVGRYGIKSEKWSTWDDERSAALMEMHARGLSASQIGRELNIGQSTISRRLRVLGVPPEARRSGANHGGWKGGRVVVHNYVYIRPTAADLAYAVPNSSGYVSEHRLVLGRVLGRPLRKDETVHHIDGDRANNAPENLQLRQGHHGSGVQMTCMDCGSHNVLTQALA